ncbi:MAG: prepilin-type N-terminal cleavage/methylation domain-containing protein, partial [Rickettsiales bacterium]|nr:prepilin-type N-terminal cleavage/methylation domain-containing protein [Rickettsiales bacterium]
RVNQKSKDNNAKNDGYTLIELSVSITIIAVLLTGGMTVLSKQDEVDKRNDTIKKINRIDRALQNYVDFNGHLPCPAVGNSLTSDAAFGISSAYDASTLNCTEVAGMVPVRTLNLNDEEAFDSWNWKFTYRIASGMGSVDSYVDPNFLGDLKIINLAGSEKTSTTSPEGRNFGAAYVLMSHGPNGSGAWPRNAAITTVAPTGMELENFNHVVNNTYIQDQTTAQYDDITAYKTRDQLSRPRISEAPIVLNSDVCSNANAIVLDGPPRTGSNSNALGDFITLTSDSQAAEQYYKSAVQLKFLCDNPPLSFKFPTPWPNILLLEDINNGDGSEGFSLYGNSSNREIGDAVSEIGDINNDGTVDFAVASSKDTSNAYVHIIFGTNDLWPEESNINTYSTSDGTKGSRLIGSSDGGFAVGDFIASLGDVNGDGIDDFFISSTAEGTRYAGGYVIYGRSAAWPDFVTLDNIAAESGQRIDGFRISFSDMNQEIVSVAGNADINNDGINDMIIGSNAEGANEEGSVFVIFGSSSLPTANTVALASPPDGFVEIETTIFNERIRSSLAIRDVNDNRFADIIIGATGIQTAA